MNQLFAVYLGGKCKGARIEVHDLAFVVASDVKAAFPQLKELWFGDKDSVHVDAWSEISYVDCHRVILQNPNEPNVDPSKKLYALNVGCYNKHMFGEEHHFFFLVGSDKNEVKARAKSLVLDRQLAHVDNLIDVDDIIELNQVNGQTISVLPSQPSEQPQINHVYWPITLE